MSDNDAAVWITGLAVFCILVSRFMKFITDIANIEKATPDKAGESAWEDEL